MNTLTGREKRDIQKMLEDKNYYSSLPERHRTATVSTVAVLECGHNLEYVPEAVLNRGICRTTLHSKEVDCTVREAVKADAYCLQLVPDKLITPDPCKTALLHPNAV